MVLVERFALLEQKYHASMKDSLEMPLLLVFALATDRLSFYFHRVTVGEHSARFSSMTVVAMIDTEVVEDANLYFVH